MAPSPRARKRIKVPSISKGKKSITTLCKPGFNSNDVMHVTTDPKISFRCPVSITKIFLEPNDGQVRQFYYARNFSGTPYDRLPQDEKLLWRQSLTDNLALIGFQIYSQLFPSLLENRIKLHHASHHYRDLDRTTAEGREKLEQRRGALSRLQRVGSAHSVFHGLPYSVDKSTSILQFMGLDFEDDDKRQRFFLQREFSTGKKGSSSVYQSCSSAIGLMWFATVVLGRPTSFESIVLPLSVVERRVLEERWLCPPRHLDGAIRSWKTDWGGVFRAINVPHRNMAYIMLIFACQDKYVEGLHVSDAFGLFKATRSAPGDAEMIATLFRSQRGIENGPVVGILDVIRQRLADSVGSMDGSILGSIYLTYGEKASVAARTACDTLQGGPTLIDSSVSSKLTEIMTHFDSQLWKTRKRLKLADVVTSNLDPAGVNKKLDGGRMLDPTDPKAVETMYSMLKGVSCGVWRPLKSLVGEAIGASMEYPCAFLQICDKEADQLYEHAKNKGVLYSDVANLCTLLTLSNCFQRSQVMREATVDEFALAPDGTHYRMTFKRRVFKTVVASRGALPVSHFNLSPEQSMIVHFLSTVGHRFCSADLNDDKRRLILNEHGEGWTPDNLRSRFKEVGESWLGIPNFSPHIGRTFYATHALNTGQVGPSNIEDFSSFLQVSAATLRSSYAAAGANTAAHKIGNDVLGGVVNSACLGETTEKGAKPSTKKLGARRMEFVADIRASLLKCGGKTMLLFRDLVSKRKAGRLGEDEQWFVWNRTFFDDGDNRHFRKFIGAHVGGA